MKFFKTVGVDELKNLLNSIQKIDLEQEQIPIDQAFNRVLAQEIISKIEVPHFRKSRMDGYAVLAEDTFNADENNEIPLKLIEVIKAGDKPSIPLKRGQCSYVATGSAIPDGANGVVMVEYTERKEDMIYVSQAITPGTYVINIGHDIKKDQVIISKNTLVDLPTIGVLASCG
ncbi:MAG: hypothetical protein P8Y23_04715, partial [Candidatus Lokiarchaeota archaeon]